MKPMQLLALLVVLVVGIVVYEIDYRQSVEQAREQAGQGPAAEAGLIGHHRPDFTLKDIDGLPRRVDEWDGHPLIINFWASWCLPCRREIPEFIALQTRHEADGLRIVGIAVDERETVKTYAEGLGIEFNYPILVGTEAAIEVARHYGNEMGILPYTVAIDRDGRIVQVQFGEFPRKDLEALIEHLL